MEAVPDLLTLRKWRDSDRDGLALLANNKNIWDCVRDHLPHPYETEDAERFIRHCRERETEPYFAIEYNGKLAGSVAIVLQSDVYMHSGELGYWVGEPFWNRGIATAAVARISGIGFRQFELERIYASVFEFNKASSRVLEKCGYQLEGIFKKGVIKNGKFWDELRYAKLRE